MLTRAASRGGPDRIETNVLREWGRPKWPRSATRNRPDTCIWAYFHLGCYPAASTSLPLQELSEQCLAIAAGYRADAQYLGPTGQESFKLRSKLRLFVSCDLEF